jgi:ABC-2 type transport system permease protein
MVKKTLKARYRRAYLGYAWTFIEPFLLSAVYYVLFTIIAGQPDPKYSLYVIVGVIVWGHFGRSLQATVNSLTNGGNLIKNVYFPREIYAITPVLANLFISLLSLSAIVPVMIYLDVTPNHTIWMVPVGLLLATILAMGVGLIMAPINAISQDVSHLFKFIVRAGFFVSPVMWTYEMMLERASGGWLDLVMLNPMVIPITLVRHGVEGTPIEFETLHLIYAVSFAVLSLLLGSAIFKRCEARVVKYL